MNNKEQILKRIEEKTSYNGMFHYPSLVEYLAEQDERIRKLEDSSKSFCNHIWRVYTGVWAASVPPPMYICSVCGITRDR